jgi:hypothetical protein
VANDGHRLVRLLEMFDLLFRQLDIDYVCVRDHENTGGVAQGEGERERESGSKRGLTDQFFQFIKRCGADDGSGDG